MSKCNEYFYRINIAKNGVIISPCSGPYSQTDRPYSSDEMLVFEDVESFLDWAKSVFPEEE